MDITPFTLEEQAKLEAEKAERQRKIDEERSKREELDRLEQLKKGGVNEDVLCIKFLLVLPVQS